MKAKLKLLKRYGMFTLKKKLNIFLVCLFVAPIIIFASGCDDSGNTEENPSQNSLEIASVTPADNALIAQNDTITAQLAYSIKDMDSNKKYIIKIWFKRDDGYSCEEDGIVNITQNQGTVEHSYTLDKEYEMEKYLKPFKIKYGLHGYDKNIDISEIDWDATGLVVSDEITYNIE